jgi:hypothetical protein
MTSSFTHKTEVDFKEMFGKTTSHALAEPEDFRSPGILIMQQYLARKLQDFTLK